MFGQGASSTVESQVTDIAILGAGAVGQLICHQLHSTGLAVGLIARETSASTSEATDWQDLVFCPLPSTDADTDSVSYRVPTFSLDGTSLLQIRLLIVCVKAYQVIDAISPLLDKLSPQCHILLLHNGMGPHLALAPKLQGRGLSLGTTSQGVMRQSRWQIKQTGQGLTQFGHFIKIYSCLSKSCAHTAKVSNAPTAIQTIAAN